MIALKEKMCFLRYIKIKPKKDVSYNLIRFISKHVRHPQDIIHVHPFFTKLYDELYHEITFKKLKIQKRVLRIFEVLALPVEQCESRRLIILCERIKQIKGEIKKPAKR